MFPLKNFRVVMGVHHSRLKVGPKVFPSKIRMGCRTMIPILIGPPIDLVSSFIPEVRNQSVISNLNSFSKIVSMGIAIQYGNLELDVFSEYS